MNQDEACMQGRGSGIMYQEILNEKLYASSVNLKVGCG